MDMTAEAMQKVLELSRPEIHTITDALGNQAPYATKPLCQVKAAPPEGHQLVNVVTLAGLADLIRADLEALDMPALATNFVIHVQDEQTVTLKPKVTDDHGRRLTLIQARPVAFRQFQFGQWMSQEEFVIAVAALFAETPDKAYVLNLASILANDATSTSEDDGFTQRANVKAGLRMKEATLIKPRVALAPYRTFPEIPQPVSEFVFRARCAGESQPMLMLVEADGGRWKINAMAEIRKAIEAFGLEIAVIA